MIQQFFTSNPRQKNWGAIAVALLFLATTGNGLCASKPVSAPALAAPTAQPVSTLPRYFFSIDLDPRYQIVGIGALTEEDAAKAKCYRFVYDTDGKLKQIEYLRAGFPLRDPFFQSSCIDFEYVPGIERRWYRTSQGDPVHNVDDIEGEELALNPAGNPTQVTNLDESGNPIRNSSGVIHYVRTLDSQGRLLVGRRVGLLGNNITDTNGFYETRSVYDNQDHRIEYGNYDASGNLLNNDDGVALVRTTYTIYPDSTQNIESYFDASGLASEEKSSGVHQRQRTYDNRGLLLSEAYFDVTGAPTVDNDSRIHERRYAYDEFGNRLSEAYFDTDGKPKNLKDGGYARVVYHYDDQDRVSEMAYFGDDGTPQVVPNLGAAVVRQEYNDQNRIVHQQFFDGQGHPSMNVKYGAVAIRIEVEGDTTMIRLRDENDQPTKNPVQGFAAFKYNTKTDKPLSPFNHYYNLRGRTLSYFPRVSIINPHLYALSQNFVMQCSARGGAAATGFGALLAAFIALRKSHHTKLRKVYVPSPLERFLGWLGIFAIFEGTIRFFITVYWSWLDKHTGQMGPGVYIFETIVILFFLYRLFRMHLTMRVLNISRDEILGIIRDFFAKTDLKPDWIEAQKTFVTPSLSVRVRYFSQKYHAYIAFYRRHREGRDLARGLAQYIRAQVGGIQCRPRSRAIALYYPVVVFCYFLLAGTAFYTFWQLVKRY